MNGDTCTADPARQRQSGRRLLVREAHFGYSLNVLEPFDEGDRRLTIFHDHPNGPALDLVLLDIHLPERDGAEALGRVRSSERYARTPALEMTACGAPGDRPKARQHAGAPFFRKPLTRAEFMQPGAILRELLARKESNNRVLSSEQDEDVRGVA